MTLEEILMGMQPRFGAAPNVLFPPPGPQTGQMMRPAPMPMPPMGPVPPALPSFAQGPAAEMAMPMPMAMPTPNTPLPVPLNTPTLPALPRMPNFATSALGQFVTGNVDPSLAAPVSPLPLPQGSAAEFLQQMLGGMVPTRTGKSYGENITVGPGSNVPSSQGATASGPPAAPPMRFGLPAPSTPGAGTTTRTMTIGGPSGPSPNFSSRLIGLESGGNASAQNQRSSAGGIGQFLDSTWAEFLKERHPDLLKGDIKALKNNEALGREAIDWYAGKNRDVLAAANLPVNDATLYLSHFLGPEGARKVLTAAPGTPIRSIVGDEAYAANTTKGGGFVYGETAGEVLKNIENKMGGEGGGGGSNPMPGAPDISAPRLPIPGATTPLKGLPENAFDQFAQLGVTRPPPRNPVDNIVAILGAMSGAAAGAKNAGDLLAAVGGAGGAQAQKNVLTSREEGKEFSQREDAMKRFQAEIGVRKAEAETQAENYRIQAQNEDKRLLNTVATEQAKLDTAAKNRVEELKSEINWKKWARFEPEIKIDKEGVTVVKRKPDGSMDVTMTRGQDMDAQAERMRNAATIYGKDSATVDVMRYQALAQAGEPFVRRQIMKDMVDNNQAIDVLGPEQYKGLRKEAEKGVDIKLQGKPEEYEAQVKQRMVDLLWQQLQGRDDVWLPKMLQKGNVGAAMLARPAGG